MELFSLPNECLTDLLSFLDEKSLFKCLFVNRNCCRLAIPILWKKPFKPSFVNEKFAAVINTLVSCFKEEEISYLIPCAIYIPNCREPLFDYGKFIKMIDQEFVKQNVITWLNSTNGKMIADRYNVAKYQDIRVRKLIDAIYHMVMRQGSNLQEFSLRVFQSKFYIDLPKFSVFTAHKPGIANMRSLKIDIDLESCDNKEYHNTMEFLSLLSTSCNSIVNCSLLIYKLNSTFVKRFLNIVRLQPLERILIYTNFLDDYKKEIIYSLEHRSNTLKELIFVYMDFNNIDLSSVSRLECLEKLEFDNCEGFSYEHCNVFSKKKFHLKELKLWHDDLDDIYGVDNVYELQGINLNVMVGMIYSLGGKSLLKLSLNVITPETVQAIKESSPDIMFLYIRIVSPKYLDPTIPLVCTFSSLKILHVQMDSYDFNSDIGRLVETLGDHLLFVECLYMDVLMGLSSFRYFTNNCKANLVKWIIPYNYNESLRKDYLVCVDNYQKVHNSLKALGMDENENGFCWENEELELVDSLKSQGADIVSSKQLTRLFY